MKKLLFVFGVAAIGFVIYVMMSGGLGGSGGSSGTTVTPIPTATPVATTAAVQPPDVRPPPAPAYYPTPVPQPTSTPYVYRPAPPAATRPAPPRPTRQPVDARSAEIKRIIYECARRAGWKITRYQQTAYGVSRVTGNAVNDNVRNQRFIDEIQRSGILVDLDTGPSRPFVGRDQRHYLESVFIIRWR